MVHVDKATVEMIINILDGVTVPAEAKKVSKQLKIAVGDEETEYDGSEEKTISFDENSFSMSDNKVSLNPATETTYGGVKIYLDEDGALHIDTEEEEEVQAND